MGFAGRLEGIAPSDIFQIISQSRMTGTLIARSPDRTAMIVFQEGQVIEATSDAPQESLGYLLASQGIVSEEMVAAAQERQKQEPDEPLGAILVKMEAISEKTLEKVVFRQIGHIVHRLMSVDDGFITFDRGEMAVKRKLNTREFILPSGVSPEYLIMERAKAEDEERRRGGGRRAEDAVMSSGGWNGVERRRGAEKQANSGNGAFLAMLLSRLRAIRLPKAAGLREGMRTVFRKGKEIAGTVLQKGQQIARSAIDRVRGSVTPWLTTALGKVRAFSPDGKALIYVGIAVIAAGAVFILLIAYSSRTSVSELLVTGRIVKIRANPTTTAKVVTKVERGATITSLSFNDGWHEVRTPAGDKGWVWQSLVERKETKGVAPGYSMLGFGLLLVAGMALLITGIMRKRMFGAAAPGFPRASDR